VIRRVVVVGLLLALAGCRPALTPAPGVIDRPSLADPPRHPGRPLLLVAMPDSAPFQAVRRSLIDELRNDFDIATFLVSARTQLPEFAARIDREGPRALVLMDNPVLSLYRRYARQKGAGRPIPPAVAVMTSFLEQLPDLHNTTGVAYEVPGVTAFVQLRSIIARQLKKVAVLHRPRFRELVQRQGRLAAKEQITLLPIEVSAEPSPEEIRTVLRRLREDGEIDAIWILNDNGLLRDAGFLSQAWRPEISRFRVPVIVGLPSLVSAEAQFGDFAVVPDHDALGVQAAQLVFKVAEADWQVHGHPVELPVSTVTVANLKRLAELAGLREGAEERVDKVVE
jgi:hypothetical protein